MITVTFKSDHKRKTISKKTREQVRQDQGVECHYCSRKTTTRNRHLDHIVPVESGGTNDPDNLVVSCKACNARKSKKPYYQYINERIDAVELELKTLRSRL